MNSYKVTQTSFTPELKDSTYKGFVKHAVHAVGSNGFCDPIAFEVNENGVSLGVCVCRLFWGNLHIKRLITKEEHRGRGVAKALMEHAFAFGKDNGCRFAFVETMSFQAPEFYKKLGFKIELKRGGYAEGVSFYYLRKDF